MAQDELTKANLEFVKKLDHWIEYVYVKPSQKEDMERFFREHPSASAAGGIWGGYVMSKAKDTKTRELAEEIHEAQNRIRELLNHLGEAHAQLESAKEIITAIGGNLTPKQMFDAAVLLDSSLLDDYGCSYCS